MKDFDDFRATLTEDNLAEIAGRAQYVLENTVEEYKSNPKTLLGNQIATVSMFIALDLLERYHEWLQQ